MATFDLFEVSDDAHAEPQPGIDALKGRVPREVAERRDLDLVGRRIGNATVVVPPVPQEVVSRRLRRERVKDLDDIAALVLGAQGDGVFAWPTVLTFAMYCDGRSSPCGTSAGKTLPQDGPACDGHQVGAAPGGEPGVSTLLFGSCGL
jgi:hypothetical protein